MRTLYILLLLFSALHYSFAQEIEFTFANAQITNDGTDDFYEVDVLISTTNGAADFKLGSGLLYFNYNTDAFGENVTSNGNVDYSYPNGTYILGEKDGTAGVVDLYGPFIENDNTDSRFAFSWQQAFGAGSYAGDNVTATASLLFHLKIKYTDATEAPGLTFEFNAPFDDQTFTACGPLAPFQVADCFNTPGTQITEDFFDSAGALLPPLPVEWLYLNAKTVKESIHLNWATATEINSAYFELQRSIDGITWNVIGTELANGNSLEIQTYDWKDQTPFFGTNYYRIRQVDLDDSFEYSKVVSVNMDKRNSDISIFPNPANGYFNILQKVPSEVELHLYDSNGILVLQRKSNEHLMEIDTKGLESGNYYLLINEAGKVMQKTISIIRD